MIAELKCHIDSAVTSEEEALRRHFSMGLALSKIGNGFVRLPSGVTPREAKVNVLGTGPLHTFLEKVCE